jgi:hypothetical protein
MKITYNNITINFFDFEVKKILLSLSGGADSASIAYLICKHFPEIEIIPFTARDENAPLDAIAATKIVKFLQKEFPNAALKDNEVFNFNDRTEKYVSWEECDNYIQSYENYKLLNRVQMSKILQIDNNAILLSNREKCIIVDGITRNPPIEIMKNLNFYEKAERRRDVIDDKLKPNIFQNRYRPFINVDKKFVADIYIKNNLLETLFPITRSCVGTAKETDNFTRECHNCFWCHEKKWAFNLKWI